MSTEIVLVRHAIAFERDRRRWPDDHKRPLSPEGREKFEKVAKGLTRWLPDVKCVLTSPLVRTRETAEMLARTGRWPMAQDCPELAPQSSPTAVLAMLRSQRARHIVLIGHEPNLSELMATCVVGTQARPFCKLKKGGVACVRFESRIQPGEAVLTAFMPPGVLRRMG